MPSQIPASDEDLLAQCRVDTYRSSGPGGQNVNRRETAVRLVHIPTGITVTRQVERSQLKNKQLALEELRRRLKSRLRSKKPRVKTRIPRALNEERLNTKRQRSETKRMRGKPSGD